MAVLRGRVFDATTRTGLEGARVEARIGQRTLEATVSGPNGTYRLEVPEGRVAVRARLRGFQEGRASVVVSGTDQTVNLFLEPEAAEEARSGHSVQVVLAHVSVSADVALPRPTNIAAEAVVEGEPAAGEGPGVRQTAVPVPVHRVERTDQGAVGGPGVLLFDGIVPADGTLRIRLLHQDDDVLWDGALEGPADHWRSQAEELASLHAGWQVRLRVAVTRHGRVRRPGWGRLEALEEFVDRRRNLEGRFDPRWFVTALRQMRRLEPLDVPAVPGEITPELLEAARGEPVCWIDGETVPCVESDPPGSVSSLGATGRYVRVDEDEFQDGVLLAPLADEELAGLDPASVRMFQWDEGYQRFRLIPRSGLDTERRIAWARVYREGVYGVFGLPADRARLDLVRTVCRIRAWERLHLEGIDVRGLREEVSRLCQLILCRPEMQEALENTALLESVGLGDRRQEDLAVYGDPPVDAKGRPVGPAPVEVPAPDRPSAARGCNDCIDNIGGGPLPDPDDPLDRRRFQGAQPLVECELIPRYPGRTTSTWYSIGPSNHAGRVKALVWHPTDPNVVYAGNSQGGVWASYDGGHRWYDRMHQQDSLVVGDLAIAPSRPDRLYAATGEYFGGGSAGQQGIGVYVSDDGGYSWTLSSTTNRRCSGIVVDPRDPDVVYLSGTAGLERSLDGGSNWTLLVMGRVDDVLLDPIDPDVLYMARDSGDGIMNIDRASTRPAADFGITSNWTSMNDGLVLTRDHSEFPYENYTRLAATAHDGESHLWCQINSLEDPWSGDEDPLWDDYGVTVYRFDGSEWEDRGTPGGTAYADWCSAIAVEPGNPDVVYSGRTSAWWTPDGGEEWHRAKVGHADTHTFAFDPSDPRRTLVGHDGGIYTATRRDQDGEPVGEELSYDDANDGHRTIQFERIAVSRRGSFGVGGSTQDQGVLVNHTSNRWDAIGGAEWGDIQFSPATGDVIVWDPKWGGDKPVLRSDDGGNSRRHFDAGLGQRHVGRISIRPDDDSEVAVATLPMTVERAGALRLPHGAANGMTDFTLSVWIRTDAEEDCTVISGANDSDHEAWTLLMKGDGSIRMFLGGTETRVSGVAVNDGVWHHLTWSRAGRFEQLQVDGTRESSITRPPGSTPDPIDIDSGGLVVGQEQDLVGGGFQTKQGFTGAMSDLRIYSRALSDSELVTVRSGGDVGSSALRGRWPLDGPFDRLAPDVSTAGRDAAVENLGVIHDGPLGGNAALFPAGRRVSSALYRWRSASVQSGFRFDGFTPVLGSPVLRLPAELLDDAGDFSVGLWIQTSRGGDATLVSAANAGEDNELVWIYRGAGDFSVWVKGTSRTISSSVSISDDNPHHLALVRSGGSAEVFIDGVSIGSASGLGGSLTIDPDGLVIGQEQDSVGGTFDDAGAWEGDLRDLTVFGSALTDGHVQDLASAGPNGALPGGVSVRARYPLDGDVGDTGGNEWHGLAEHVTFAQTSAGTVARFAASPAKFRDLTHSPLDTRQLYAVDEARRIWHSRDHGFHWEHVGTAPSSVDPSGLTVDWVHPFRIYLASYGTGRKHAWRSDDGGVTWHDIDGIPPGDLPDAPVARIIPSDRASDTLFAAADVGVLRTDDGGQTWYAWDQGLPNAPCTDIDLRPADGELYASTYGRGAYARKI